MAKDKKAPEAEPVTDEARPGWIRALVSTKDEDGEYHFAASSAGKTVAKVYGMFYIDVPVTAEAQAEAMAGASTSFDLEGDKKVKVEGPQAPAARKYYADALEPKRGDLRKLALEGVSVSASELQAMLDSAQPYTGRSGFTRPEVSEADLEDAANDIDKLKALLAKSGVKLS